MDKKNSMTEFELRTIVRGVIASIKEHLEVPKNVEKELGNDIEETLHDSLERLDIEFED